MGTSVPITEEDEDEEDEDNPSLFSISQFTKQFSFVMFVFVEFVLYTCFRVQNSGCYKEISEFIIPQYIYNCNHLINDWSC